MFWFQAIEENKPVNLKDLLVFLTRLQIETPKDTTGFDALGSCMMTLASLFRSPNGISARQAVINVMEATHMLPGVFNLQMLSWRQKLLDIVHNPNLITGYSSLKYQLPLSFELANELPTSKSVAVQTKLTNPNSNEILEFVHKDFQLKWVLDS